MHGTKAAASAIYKAMLERGYSTEAWSQHELHPKPSEGFTEVDIVNFVFTMDLLNFSYAILNLYGLFNGGDARLTLIQLLVRTSRLGALPGRVHRQAVDGLQQSCCLFAAGSR